MPSIYISEDGDDNNEGTLHAPIYSWHRRLRLKTGNDEIVIIGDSEATISRLHAEIKQREKT
jgi:hypothetical protein